MACSNSLFFIIGLTCLLLFYTFKDYVLRPMRSNLGLLDISQGNSRINAQNLTVASEHLIEESGVLRSCLTEVIYGSMPTHSNYKTVEFPSPKEKSKETRSQRIDSFKKVYDKREWGATEDNVVGKTASGGGSTLVFTKEISATLHNVINHIKKSLKKDRISMLDIPCGDMQWMHRFLEARLDVDYTGMDIVAELINKHKVTFKKEPWTFIYSDVVADGLRGSYDLVFSRMMMQHLNNEDTEKLLYMVSSSGSKFLLTTTFPTLLKNVDLNSDITGRFHGQNLELPPFSLTPPLCIAHDGPRKTQVLHHFIALWKLPLKKLVECTNVRRHTLPGLNLYRSCCLEYV